MALLDGADAGAVGGRTMALPFLTVLAPSQRYIPIAATGTRGCLPSEFRPGDVFGIILRKCTTCPRVRVGGVGFGVSAGVAGSYREMPARRHSRY